MNRIGLGLAAIARPAYITTNRGQVLGERRTVEQLRTRSERLLDTAYAAGVRYFDVARSYGRAEEFLAGWLAAHPDARDVTIGSKWGYRYIGEWRQDAAVHEVKDHSLAAFERQSAESSALLGERLDVYHVHSATLETGVLADRSVHRALAALRDRGVRIGISTSGPAQADAVRTALDVRLDGAALFTSFECTWNPLEPSVGPALAEAADAGAWVIVKEAVANGRLAPGGRDGSPGVARAEELATGLGVPLDQLALAAALAQPWASWVLSGAIDVSQLTSNLAAGTVNLPTQVRDELATLAEPAKEYWSARAARPWR